MSVGGGWGEGVCMCVCKYMCVCEASFSVLQSICVCVCMPAYVCACVHQSSKQRKASLCKVICMLLAEQQLYSPRGYEPGWMWNKQLLLPKPGCWFPPRGQTTLVGAYFVMHVVESIAVMFLLIGEWFVSRAIVSHNLISLAILWCKHLELAPTLTSLAQPKQVSTDILDSRSFVTALASSSNMLMTITDYL